MLQGWSGEFTSSSPSHFSMLYIRHTMNTVIICDKYVSPIFYSQASLFRIDPYFFVHSKSLESCTVLQRCCAIHFCAFFFSLFKVILYCTGSPITINGRLRWFKNWHLRFRSIRQVRLWHMYGIFLVCCEVSLLLFLVKQIWTANKVFAYSWNVSFLTGLSLIFHCKKVPIQEEEYCKW